MLDSRRVLAWGVGASVLLTTLIWVGGGIPAVAKLPDQGALWHYWKLPKPTFWTHHLGHLRRAPTRDLGLHPVEQAGYRGLN